MDKKKINKADEVILELADLCNESKLIDLKAYNRICSDCGRELCPRKMTAKQFKQIRKRQNLSQATLASMIGASSSTVAKWEQGLNMIPPMAATLMRTIDKNGIAFLVV